MARMAASSWTPPAPSFFCHVLLLLVGCRLLCSYTFSATLYYNSLSVTVDDWGGLLSCTSKIATHHPGPPGIPVPSLVVLQLYCCIADASVKTAEDSAGPGTCAALMPRGVADSYNGCH